MTKKRIPLWGAGLLTAAGLAVGAGAGYLAPHPNVLPEGFGRVLQTYQTVSQNYYEKVDQKKLADGAITGMLGALDDPYSVYLQQQDAAGLNTQISGAFGGIGATMVQTTDGVLVDSLTAHGAAQKAGIKAHDQIVSVDGKDVTKKDINAIVAKVRGKIGTKVTVGIRRGKATHTFTMTRAKVTIPSLSGKLNPTNKQVGIISFSTFTDSSAKELRQAVTCLQKQGAKKLVLDLRGNPGGVLQEALKINSMFLKDGKVMMQVQDRDGKKTVYKAGEKYDKGHKIKLPTVVLIDGNSASASEIVAAALHQSAGVPLVGTKSYGKGTVQTVADMGKDTELKLTIAKWLTPDGTWINHKGLQPTVKADYPAYAYLPTIAASELTTGATGQDVITLQKMLTALGQKVADSGTYDAATRTAVMAFQSNNQLTASGTADGTTLAAVEAKLAAQARAHDNAMKEALKLLQTKNSGK